MAELAPGTVRLGRPLEAITGTAASPYTCHFADSSTAVADHLVLALPFRVLRDITIDPAIESAFSTQKQQAIAGSKMGTNAKLHLQFTERTWTNPITVDGESLLPNGVTYSDPDGYLVVWDATVAHPSPQGLLTNYLGGQGGTKLRGPGAFGTANIGDVNSFLSDIDVVWPGTSDACNGKALKSSWIDNPWSLGAYSHWGLGDNQAFVGAEAVQEGNIHFAGEHTSVEYQGFMEGAVRSGARAADEVRMQI